MLKIDCLPLGPKIDNLLALPATMGSNSRDRGSGAIDFLTKVIIPPTLGEEQNELKHKRHCLAKISEPGTGTTSTVPISDIRTVND